MNAPITPKHPSATERVHQALAAGAHQICAEDVTEMLKENPNNTDLLAALETVKAKAATAFSYLQDDKDIKVGKLLKALADHLQGYDPSIDRAHETARAARAGELRTMTPWPLATSGQPANESIILLLEETANLLSGMQFDMTIPEHARAAMARKVNDLNSAINAATA